MTDTKEHTFPIVVKILDDTKVVINRGSKNGLRVGQRLVFFEFDTDDIIDPISKLNLGKLEIVKGTGKIIHVQENLATVESDKTSRQTKTIVKKPIQTFWQFVGEEEVIIPGETLPFDNIKIGDFAKPV